MADAEDLKSSGDFSSCGFDSHPGHHLVYLNMKDLFVRALPCTSDRGSQRSPNSLRVVPVENAPTVRNASL
jgi:hypothetical protein